MEKRISLPRLHEHKYTRETIYHFTCGGCKNWWSYASTKAFDALLPFGRSRSLPDEYEMFCPHCKHKAFIQPK